MNKHDIIRGKLKKGVSYTVQHDTLCFLPGGHKAPSVTSGTSLLGNIQDFLKRWGVIYYGCLGFFQPVWRSTQMKRQLNNLLQRHDQNAIILNLGSGPRILKGRRDIINVDLYGFSEVDMIAEASDLPLEDGSVDFIINQAMLEHVSQPEDVVQEIFRLLRPGGEAFCYLPFIVPFHAAPHDFHRWTMPGVSFLFQDFDQLEIGIGAGPTSGTLWVVLEWLAILLSFGSRWLHDIIFLVLMVVATPIKVMDSFLIRHPYAEKIASGFYVIAKKG